MVPGSWFLVSPGTVSRRKLVPATVPGSGFLVAPEQSLAENQEPPMAPGSWFLGFPRTVSRRKPGTVSGVWFCDSSWFLVPGFHQTCLSHKTRNRQRFLVPGSWFSPEQPLAQNQEPHGSGFRVPGFTPPPPRTQKPGTAKPRTVSGSWLLVPGLPQISLS